MTARFRVVGRIDRAGVQTATVAVDRAAGTFSVRPLRRRRAYTLPLSVVAAVVASLVCKAEAVRVRAERKAKRATRRRAA